MKPKMKSEFVAIVSHEIKNPMGTAKLGVQTILDGLCGAVNEKQKQILSTIARSINRLLNITNDLLDVGKIEAGKLELKKVSFDLCEVIREAVSTLGPRLENSGLSVTLQLPKSLFTEGDAEKITQVFTNLLSNSIKFTPKGGITIGAEEKEKTVECNVSDTGLGLAPEEVAGLFNKYKQFGKSSVTGEKGTGLGLTIVKNLVEAHGGKIWVASKQGEGTTFTFSLPKE